MRKYFLILLLVCVPSARATIITAASCSEANVQTAVNSAVTGDTVIVPGTCSVSWASAVNIGDSQGITIQASGSVTLTNFGFNASYVGASMRVTGFTFTSLGDGGGHARAIIEGGDTASSLFRIDHNTFTNGAQSVFIEIYGFGPSLVDHNTFTGGAASESVHVRGSGNDSDPTGWTLDVTPGGPLMTYIEDNTFNTSSTSIYCSGIQSYEGARTVVRHNTFNYCQVDQHGTCGAINARWWEIYDNTFHVPGSQNQAAYMALRGGSGVVWGNSAPDANTGAGSLELTEDCTSGTYPLNYQVGRGINEKYSPAYLWGNDATLTAHITSGSSYVNSPPDYLVSVSQPATLKRCQLSTDSGTGSTCTTTYSYVPYTYPYPTGGPGLSITSLSQSSGQIGTPITITGTGFGVSQGGSTVTFNPGITGTPTSWSDTSIQVRIPAGMVSGNLLVTVSGVTSNAVNFTILPTPPTGLTVTVI